DRGRERPARRVRSAPLRARAPERAAARRSLRPLRVDTAYGFPQLQPDTDPASVAPALAPTRKPMRLQFDVPLPERLVDAAAEALREHRHVGLYAYGR